MQLTIIDDEARVIDAHVDGDRVLLDPADFAVAAGWEVKPEGFCQGEVCVPMLAPTDVLIDGRVDLFATMSALDRPVLAALDDAVIALGQRAENRDHALRDLRAAPFELPDLDGNPHRFDDWLGKRKVLVAFSTW